MPYTAFRSEPVNEKITIKIESIETWGEKLVVGLTDGSLLVLDEAEDCASFHHASLPFSDWPFLLAATLPEYNVTGTKRNIAKTAIKQIQVCEALGCAVLLSGSNCVVNFFFMHQLFSEAIQVHGIPNFEMKSLLTKTRGANAFEVSPGPLCPFFLCLNIRIKVAMSLFWLV